MKSYEITLNFATLRPLTNDELQLLCSQIMAQVEEPADAEGNDADYKTSLLTFNSKENK